MDYYVSSELVEPPNAEEHYSERLVVARTLLCYRRRARFAAQPWPREPWKCRQDEHLYVCAQQLGKFHPDFDAVLGAILRRDPLGRILITSDRCGHEARRLRNRFDHELTDVADRITFVGRQEVQGYLSLLAAADVLLDPLHFGGVNSTYDGLSLNQPIVTLPGAFHRARYTYGCYRKMECMDCVVSSPQEYVDLAVRIASESDYRAAVVERLRERTSVLFEDPGAVSEHERILSEWIEAHHRP
jgi:predicted O-linked N-acetylglucosamine transferase (SPINDLY family)